MPQQLSFKLRKNNPYNNPDYKYELDIDTNDVKLISEIINSTSFVETDNETGVTLYTNNKQALLAEKERIQRLIVNYPALKHRACSSQTLRLRSSNALRAPSHCDYVWAVDNALC